MKKTERATVSTPLRMKLALVVLGSVLALLVGELVVRGLESYQYSAPSNRDQFVQYTKVFSDERGTDHVFGHRPNVAAELEREGIRFTFFTNSDGLRERQDYARLEKSVLFLGDSIVEGASVENHETMDEVFERLTGVTTLNFGLGSSNTVQQFHWLKAKVRPEHNPRVVVLGFCLNDFPQNTYLRYFDPKLGNWRLYRRLSDDELGEAAGESGAVSASPGRPAGWRRVGRVARDTAKRSRLLTFVHGSLSELRRRGEKSLPFTADAVSERQKSFTEHYLAKIQQLSHQLGAELVVVIFPQASQLEHRYPPGGRMQDVLIEILERRKIEHIDLYDVMKAAYRAEPEIRWYHDDTHPYKAGHRLYGEFLAEVLVERFPDIFARLP